MFRARSESAQADISRMSQRATCASRRWFLLWAEPDIHLLPRAPKSRHRRLSLCSLPVPKQFEESLGSVISFAQSATCRTWQSAHCVSCFFSEQFYAAAVLRSSAGIKSRLLPIHGQQIRHHLPGYGECRPIPIAFLFLPFVDHG